jgi:hypothetical protein
VRRNTCLHECAATGREKRSASRTNALPASILWIQNDALGSVSMPHSLTLQRYPPRILSLYRIQEKLLPSMNPTCPDWQGADWVTMNCRTPGRSVRAQYTRE